jgi:hypothetical protein
VLRRERRSSADWCGLTNGGSDWSIDCMGNKELAGRFLAVASGPEFADCPLYVGLARLVAADPAALGLYDDAPATQQIPNLLFAAVHASLLRDPSHELAAWFRTLAGTKTSGDAGLADALHAFVVARRDELHELVSSRSTQTNEVGRVAILLPSIAWATRDVGGPLGLVEIGASAGLNLRLDHVHCTYDIGGAVVACGPDTSRVRLVSEVDRSSVALPFDAIAAITIATRRGLDINPLDVEDESQMRWLQALVWPDQPERFERLRAAIDLARDLPVPVAHGDAVDDVCEVIDAVPGDEHPTVVTAWTLAYLPEERRCEFVAKLNAIGAERDLSWISIEHPSFCSGLPVAAEAASTLSADRHPVSVHRYRDGVASRAWIATTHPHGRTFAWHPPGTQTDPRRPREDTAPSGR